MRAIWSGFISFGLINLGVKLYNGTEDHGLSFDLFHGADYAPIRYARICQQEGKEVPWEEVVKGYEYGDGEFIMLTPQDFEAAKVEHEKTIEIFNFVEEKEVDPIYFEKPYYLEPSKGGAKSYSLLREALKNSRKCGIARYFFHQRERYGILKPYGNLLMLNQIRIAEDIRSTEELKIPETSVTKQEIEMAKLLIDNLTGKFEPKKYHDSYTERLRGIIEQKAQGRKVKRPKKEKEVASTKVVNLMEMLKKSIAAEQKKNGKVKKKKIA